DTYYYDHINDRAYDSSAANGGTDIVFSSVTATLNTWIENLTLTGTGNLTGVGNALENVITGNSGNNLLSGGAGADTMHGGLGNDTFIFDNAGDRAFDEIGASGGIDTVQSSVTTTLSAWIENLTLIGTAKIDGIGNALDNVLIGNSNANVLIGGAGNDTYYYDHASDMAFDSSAANGGIDIIFSAVTATLDTWIENLTLTGSGNLTGVGNDLVNTIAGNLGDNLLAGMAGADTLSGGGGNDTFVYHNAAHSTSTARDQINGFDLGDKIDLSRIDANTGTGADDAFAFIGAAAFSNTAGELRAYQSGGDWFVEGDIDGDGVADLMIGLTTTGGYAIVSTDFIA
ncbi:MAG TPA: calcium-binding protein, partial [Allosphingosinicella sp.]|nr:calcium-binding protein [Allosphingosinicella sp.]